jgi:hypothetical protein
VPLSPGLKIVHAVSGYPRTVIFWTFAFARLRSQLEKFGYHIAT